jgi:hypothetical protein
MSNEAAQRLHHALISGTAEREGGILQVMLDAALAIERRAGRDEAIDSFTERLDGLLAGERRAVEDECALRGHITGKNLADWRADERRATVERIRAALPDDWREQLTIINAAVRTPANAEQLTLLDLSNKALRVLDAILDAEAER